MAALNYGALTKLVWAESRKCPKAPKKFQIWNFNYGNTYILNGSFPLTMYRNSAEKKILKSNFFADLLSQFVLKKKKCKVVLYFFSIFRKNGHNLQKRFLALRNAHTTEPGHLAV